MGVCAPAQSRVTSSPEFYCFHRRRSQFRCGISFLALQFCLLCHSVAYWNQNYLPYHTVPVIAELTADWTELLNFETLNFESCLFFISEPRAASNRVPIYSKFKALMQGMRDAMHQQYLRFVLRHQIAT